MRVCVSFVVRVVTSRLHYLSIIVRFTFHTEYILEQRLEELN